jgi:transposase
MIVKERPTDLGIPFSLWSQAAVREAIRIRCGIEMSPRTVYSYLERWGYTSQRPAKMAIERDAEWVQLWMKHELPAIQARVAAEKGVLYWADETAIQQGASWAKGYSPKGETPILKMAKKNIGRISMVCASSPEGVVKFSFKEGGFNWQSFKEFLEFLIKDQADGKKIFMIVDNASIHNATAIHDWLELPEIRQKIEIFYIPPYSPDCNPQELINNSLKTKIRSSPPASRLGDLLKIAYNFMKDLVSNPTKIKNHFKPFMTSLKLKTIQT